MAKFQLPNINKLHLGEKKPQDAMPAAVKLNGVFVVAGPAFGSTTLTGAALAIARGAVTTGANEGPVNIGAQVFAANRTICNALN